jgi:lysozyme family protein
MKLIDDLIDREGGYIDHPSDKGGPTNWGITQVTARAYGYQGLMRDLKRETAVAIYKHKYIVEPGFDKVLMVSERIGEEMIDTGVNMGVSIPGPWLQRILNVMNQQARTFPDLLVDGQLGPATITALRTVIRQRGPDGVKIINRALNCLQGARYLEITEARVKNEDFYCGWMLNRVALV